MYVVDSYTSTPGLFTAALDAVHRTKLALYIIKHKGDTVNQIAFNFFFTSLFIRRRVLYFIKEEDEYDVFTGFYYLIEEYVCP